MAKKLKVYTRPKPKKLEGKLRPKKYPPTYKTYARRRTKGVK